MMVSVAQMAAKYAPRRDFATALPQWPRLFPLVTQPKIARRKPFPWPYFSLAAFAFLTIAVQTLPKAAPLSSAAQKKRKSQRALLRQTRDLEARFQRRRLCLQKKTARSTPQRGTVPLRTYAGGLEKKATPQPAYRKIGAKPLPLSPSTIPLRKAS
jgi:hypothetical protein